MDTTTTTTTTTSSASSSSSSSNDGYHYIYNNYEKFTTSSLHPSIIIPFLTPECNAAGTKSETVSIPQDTRELLRLYRGRSYSGFRKAIDASACDR